MINNELKHKVQQRALEKWIYNGKRGTCLLTTGLGKTILSLQALYTMPKDDSIQHLFLAEQIDRQKDLIKDIMKFNQIFNKNVLEDYRLQFQCYQTVRNWKNRKLGLVICDEIPDSLSRENFKFYQNNECQAILGLSAYINREIYYSIDGKVISKGELMDQVAPVCFTYTLNDAQREGTSRKLNVYVINHELDNVNKTIESGTKKHRFYQTELKSYEYWDKLLKKYYYLEPEEDEDIYKFEETKNIKILSTLNKRNKILYKLPSKIEPIKRLLKEIEGKSIIFANDIDTLTKITPNVVSSRSKQSENDSLRDKFDKGIINTIGSFKKLEQGANLEAIDNCILHSYYGIEGRIIQRLGRLRQNGDKVGNVFVFVTKDTQEEKWFQKGFDNLTEFNIINCNSIEDCISKYRENVKI